VATEHATLQTLSEKVEDFLAQRRIAIAGVSAARETPGNMMWRCRSGNQESARKLSRLIGDNSAYPRRAGQCEQERRDATPARAHLDASFDMQSSRRLLCACYSRSIVSAVPQPPRCAIDTREGRTSTTTLQGASGASSSC